MIQRAAEVMAQLTNFWAKERVIEVGLRIYCFTLKNDMVVIDGDMHIISCSRRHKNYNRV